MKTLFSLTLLAALTGPIYAVDGVVLINQSSALAGNVTPGDTPGFPVSITVSGSYRLSGNLIVPDANTDGIDVTADNVTIDLNGFSIIGPVVCSRTSTATSCSPQGSAAGITSSNVNAVVLNGAIRGMGFGILSRAFKAVGRVEKVQISSNSGEGINVGDGIEISSCAVTLNGGYGIVMGGGVVSGSIASFNQGSGIQAGGAVVTGNATFSNGLAGIVAICPGTLVTGNTAVGNAGGNIAFDGSGCVSTNNAAP